jgi:hypothetical protein
MLREAAQQALEALEIEQGAHAYLQLSKAEHIEEAITALRAALAQEAPKGGGNLPPPLAGRAGAAAEREKVAHWMRSMGYATGHGDTIEDLLDHLGTQIAEGLEAEVLMEREACARIAETKGGYTHLPTGVQICGSKAAAAIRARSKE